MKQDAVVVGRHAVEWAQREHARRELGRAHLPARGQRGHGLVVEQAEGQTVQTWWLDPAFLQVELDQGDALQELPGDGLAQGRTRLGRLLPHHKPHLGRRAAPARAAHALQEARHRERRINLEGPLEAADIDAQLECRGCDRGKRGLLVLHEVLGRFAQRSREVAVVDEETVGLVVGLAVGAQGRRNGLSVLAGVGENQAFATARVLEDIAQTRVGECRRLICLALVLGAADGVAQASSARTGSAPHSASVVPCSAGVAQRLGRRIDIHRRSRLLGVCGRCPRARHALLRPVDIVGRLAVADVEVLHREAPALAFVIDTGDDRVASRARREDLARALRVTHRGGEADAARVDPGHA